jgi:hypothetical protein
MDSSDSPTYGEQEGSAYNGHFGCTCYHPLFVFNVEGVTTQAIKAPRDQAIRSSRPRTLRGGLLDPSIKVQHVLGPVYSSCAYLARRRCIPNARAKVTSRARPDRPARPRLSGVVEGRISISFVP